ncbi:MAG: DUF3658 domain-containing protein [Eubacteriaceae bacterium]
MLELIFSDSGAASLAYAKETGDTANIASVEICIDHEGNETVKPIKSKPYTGEKIKGDTLDVISIWLMGDVGDISMLPDWNSRSKMMREISNIHAMEPEDWVEEASKNAKALVKKLYEAAKKGDSIRVWWSDMPHEACGYYWAMSVFENSNGNITSVKVPRIYPTPEGCKVIEGTGDLQPEDFVSLISSGRRVEMAERHTASMLWKKMVAENAMLRVVINGVPCSVPEDFYDWVLRKILPDGEFSVAEAIGKALMESSSGGSDWWYAKRIRHLIDCKELEIVKDNKEFYCAKLRKLK